MLNRLRIGPKLLLAPALVLLLLILSSTGAWYGMVRQNASLENMVRVRITHLKAAADILGEAKQVHGNMYQLLSWTNGSFAKARIDALEQQIKARHAAIGSQLAALRGTATGAERNLVDAAITALAAGNRVMLKPSELTPHTAAALAELDVLSNLAERALNLDLNRPRFVEEPCMRISQGRHPVVEQVLTTPFVANDLDRKSVV